MGDKFNIYEVLSWLVPGTLLIALVALCFPALTAQASAVKFPDAFGVICLVALAVFLGNLIQAVASILEGIMNWTWGGRPSEVCLQKGLGDRYVPLDTANRIRAKLETASGSTHFRSLFIYAMGRPDVQSSARVNLFNALYAYHRALLVLSVIGVAVLGFAMADGHLDALSNWTKGLLVAASLVTLALIWHRTKQRAFYYVREVLLNAERSIDQPNKTTVEPKEKQ